MRAISGQLDTIAPLNHPSDQSERQSPPGTERSRLCRARRLAAGLCQACGLKREGKYKYRCASCQQKERLRWRRTYEHNFGWFHLPERRAFYSTRTAPFRGGPERGSATGSG
jgi:hypothetical protein